MGGLLKKPLVEGARQQAQEDLRKASVSNDCEKAKAALADGADVNFIYEEGRTALMKASLRGHVEMVVLLLDAGARGDIVDNHNYTAFLLAKNTGETAAVELLKSRGILK